MRSENEQSATEMKSKAFSSSHLGVILNKSSSFHLSQFKFFTWGVRRPFIARCA
jgi:hypothetical protein